MECQHFYAPCNQWPGNSDRFLTTYRQACSLWWLCLVEVALTDPGVAGPRRCTAGTPGGLLQPLAPCQGTQVALLTAVLCSAPVAANPMREVA